jgi:proline iminopeptidase
MPPVPPPRESGTTRSTDVPLYWCAYGPPGSPRLLVLHGGPGAHHDYLLPQMLRLAENRDLLFYDQRGGGRSKVDSRMHVTWRAQVEDLDRVVGEFAIEPLTIVGYSWGGLLAMLYTIESAAGRTTHHPSRLVLIDPAPVSRSLRSQFEAELARRNAAPDIERLRQELAASGLRERDVDAYRQRAFELGVAGYFYDPRAAVDLTPFRVVGRVQQSVWDSLGEFDLTAPGQLDSVSVPTLVLHGREDPIPLTSSELASQALGAELVVIDRCGHVPYVEQPDALFAAIERFLEIGERSGPPTLA